MDSKLLKLIMMGIVILLAVLPAAVSATDTLSSSFTKNVSIGARPLTVQVNSTTPNNLFYLNIATGSESVAAGTKNDSITGFVRNHANTTLTASTDYVKDGTQSLRIDTTAYGSPQGGYVTSPYWINVDNGTTYTASVWLRGNIGGETIRLYMSEYDGSSWKGETSAGSYTLTTTWTRYSVSRTMYMGGNHSAFLLVKATPPAVSTFYADDFQYEKVTATNTSANDWSTPINSWNWSWGDGTWTNTTTTGSENPTHTYSSAGIYSVYLITSNAGGTSTSASQQIEVFDGITTRPVPSINNTRFSPISDTNIPPSGTTISKNVTRGNREASSFIIKPNRTLTDVTITATDLTDGLGHTIPKENTIIQTVKAWYQSNSTDIRYRGAPIEYNLIPELLLNNDSTVRVNYTAQTNEVWIYNTTYPGGIYVHIDNTSIEQFPADAKIYDNSTVSGFPVPFALPANENKQIWMTTYIPTTQAPGNYTGTISITSSLTDPVTLTLNVRVLPFTLQPTTKVQQGIYFNSRAPESRWGDPNLTPTWQTETQIALELADMKAHGIQYPILTQRDAPYMSNQLTTRAALGFPTDKIFVYSPDLNSAKSIGIIPYAYNATVGQYVYVNDTANRSVLTSQIASISAVTTAYGYKETYYYGMDEPYSNAFDDGYGASLFDLVHSLGGKVFFATDNIPIDRVPTSVDLNNAAFTSSAVPYGYKNDTAIALIHSRGGKVGYYNHPQTGVELPETYRKTFGIELWTSGIDMAFDYAYQHQYHSAWNDYDSYDHDFRDHMMTYPKTEGVISTIQWEGYREGVDDSRHLDTLVHYERNTVNATAIANACLASGNDMSVCRGTIIDRILTRYNEQGFTSQNVTHRYTKPGRYNVTLTATNAYGSSTSYMWVTVTKGGIQQGLFDGNPLMVNYDEGTYTSSRELTDAESIVTVDNMDKMMVQ